MWLVLALAIAFYRRSARAFVLVLLADAAAFGLSEAVKGIVGERRPHGYDPLAPLPHSSSFPSGHATMSFACATVLSALVPRAAPAFVALAAAIAYSRLYLGVHWPGDVVAGAALGIATALLLLEATRQRSGGRRRRG